MAMNPKGRFQSVTRLPKLVNTQALTGFSTHLTIQSTPTLFYPSFTTQENGPPSLPHSPSGYPLPSMDLVHLVKNLHVRTLKIRSCEHILLNVNVALTYMNQFMVGNTLVILTSNQPWFLSFNNLFPLFPRKKRMREERY